MLVCAYEFRARRTPGRWQLRTKKVSRRNSAPSRIQTNEESSKMPDQGRKVDATGFMRT